MSREEIDQTSVAQFRSLMACEAISNGYAKPKKSTIKKHMSYDEVRLLQ